MKKILSFVLSILVVLSLMPTTFALATVKDGNETKIGGFAYTWIGIAKSDYSRVIQAKISGTIETKSVNEIGINYCELLDTATPTQDGSFRVWTTDYTDSNFPDGVTSSKTYIIPRDTSRDLVQAFYVLGSDKDSIDINIQANALNPTVTYNKSEYDVHAQIEGLEINSVDAISGYDSNGAVITNFSEDGKQSINIKRSQLHEGNNTITIGGFTEMKSNLNPLDTHVIFGSKTFTIVVYNLNRGVAK